MSPLGSSPRYIRSVARAKPRSLIRPRSLFLGRPQRALFGIHQVCFLFKLLDRFHQFGFLFFPSGLRGFIGFRVYVKAAKRA